MEKIKVSCTTLLTFYYVDSVLKRKYTEKNFHLNKLINILSPKNYYKIFKQNSTTAKCCEF